MPDPNTKGDKNVTAEWNASLTVSCPHCGEYQGNILDDIQDNFERLGKWYSDETNLHIEMKCKDCNKNYIINETTY